MPSPLELGSAHRSAFSPLTIVQASPELQPFLAENGLQSMHQLLAPFQLLSRANLQRADSLNGTTYTLEQFHVRFRPALPLSNPSGVPEPTIPAPNLAPNKILEIRVPKDAAPYKEDPVDLHTPWFAQYRAGVLDAFGASEHETFHHPVAEMYFTSCLHADPLDALAKMQDVSKLPPQYEQFMISPEVLRFFVVVHDQQRTDLKKSEELMEAVKKRFGLHSFLLKVNSLNQEQAHTSLNSITDMYTNALGIPANYSATGPPPYARRLSNEDVKSIQKLVQGFVAQSLVPYMDRNIQLWNEQVASSRRGITGRLFQVGKRYFGSSSGKQSSARQISFTSLAGEPMVTLTVYPAASPEALMRKLADYAFMLQDYSFAHVIYDNVKKDFQSDRAHKYYAGVQEMIGICLILSGDRRESESYYESAIGTYQDQKEVKYALRTTLLFYETLKSARQYKDAARTLIRGVSETNPWRSALFYEQVAHCYLRTPISLIRKYAFYLVLAGMRYQALQQFDHAQRCYRGGNMVYETKNWSLVKDHVNATIAANALRRSDWETGLKHVKQLLHSSRGTRNDQQVYLAQFSDFYSKLRDAGAEYAQVLENLSVPSLEPGSLTITSAAAIHQQQQDEEHMAFPEEVWMEMEKDLSASKGLLPGVLRPASGQPVFAVKEPVKILLRLSNPLQIPLSLTNICLECSFTSDQRELHSTASPVISVQGAIVQYEGFSVKMVPSISLQPGLLSQIKLTLIPEMTGTIRILGLRYMINNLVPARMPVSKKGPLAKKEKSDDHSLDLIITPPMPRLDVTFQDMSSVLFSGEVRQRALLLRNDGELAMRALVVKISHPGFFWLCNTDSVLEKVQDHRWCIKNRLVDTSVMDIAVPGGVIEPGQTVSIPMWVRGEKIGKHHVRFLFDYQAEVQ